MLILFFLITMAFANTDVRSLAEKTYSRDNSFCQIGKEKIQIQIRSLQAFTEAKEKSYGNLFFYYPSEKAELLPVNADEFHSYRFFKGTGTLCSKSLGFTVSENQMAILFMQENSPDDDKLTILLFNTQTMRPENVIETNYPTSKAQATKDGFAFGTVQTRQSIDMGKVKIKGEEFNFHDHPFTVWIKYTTQGFSVADDLTFEKFQWKNIFKDSKDFNLAASWDKKENKFLNTMFYLAINHKLKKECVLFLAEKKKITGEEADWYCN